MTSLNFGRFKINKFLVYSTSTAIACVATFRVVYERQRLRVLAESEGSPLKAQQSQREKFLLTAQPFDQVRKSNNNEFDDFFKSKDTVDDSRLKNTQIGNSLKLDGYLPNWTPILYIRLMQNYSLDQDVATHLANSYGDKAFLVARLAEVSGRRWPVVGRRLHPHYPYLEAEVRFALQEYFACSVVDFIFRQTPFSSLDVTATKELLPRIVAVIAEEQGWNDERQEEELKNAMAFLDNKSKQYLSESINDFK